VGLGLGDRGGERPCCQKRRSGQEGNPAGHARFSSIHSAR